MDNRLIQRYISGHVSEDEKKQILNWLEADEQNMRHYMALRKLFNFELWRREEKKETTFSRKLTLEILKIAAVFILSFYIGGIFSGTSGKESVTMQSVYVPMGQHVELMLADGSKVWLNAGSRFFFPTSFSDDVRQVKLEGEGFFEVQTDKERPFIVCTPEYKIKALGTSFNVFAYEDTELFEASLLEGKIEVCDNNRMQRIALSPNQKVSLENGRLKTLPIMHSDYFLWREGIISFDNEPVLAVMQKLELYFDVKMNIINEQVKANHYHYTGKFRMRDGLEHILKVLQMKKRFTYQVDEDTNTIEIK